MTFLTRVSEKSKDSYKILSLPDSANDVLQSQHSRRKTDKFFLIVFVASIISLLPLLIYTLYYSDINRLKGYDKCGNICGQENVVYDEWGCTGEDMTFKPSSAYYDRCEETNQYYGFYPFDNGEGLFYTIPRNMSRVVLVSFLPLGLCLMLVVLFRYHPVVGVCSILIGFWLVITTTVGFFLCISLYWYGLPLAIYVTISTMGLSLYFFFNLNSIQLATPLLKEATRALFEVKMMSFILIGALSSLIVILLFYTIVTFHMATSGKLTELYSGKLDYIADNFIIATMILSSIIAFWAGLIVLGVHYMTVGGTVAQWYTIRDQDNLVFAPSNLHTAVNYHMGTVALGSVMMTIMIVPRSILQFLAIFSALKQKADSGLRYLDGFFTNNSYIITGMYGTSFIRSGKKAANLLRVSIGDTRDLNSFANSIIQIAQVIIVFVSTLVTLTTLRDDKYGFIFTFIECGIASACVYAILGSIKVSTNTLFFCATEEFLKNKETDLPYNMAMKEFLDGSNKLFIQKVQDRPCSNVTEKRFCIKLFSLIFVIISFVLFPIAYFI